METANDWNFSKSKRHISVNYGAIVSKTELDLDIHVIYLYTKFHYSMCTGYEKNERKLNGPTDRPTDSRKAIDSIHVSAIKIRNRG